MAQDSWARELFREVLAVFHKALYADILVVLDAPKENAKDSALTAALRSGRIVYKDGEFKGDFTAAISRELKELGATFDGRTRAFTLPPSRLPGNLHQWVLAQNERVRLQSSALTDTIAGTSARVSLALGQVDFAALASKVESTFDAGLLSTIGEAPEITPALRTALQSEYTGSTTLAIQNFAESEAQTLRQMVESSVMQGFRASKLVPEIYARQRISVDRAKFVAYQETNLFSSTLAKTKYTQAGVTHYRWRTVGDSLTRPDHAELDGKVFTWNDPPIVDSRTGRRRHPREDYGCRCEAIPLVGYDA